MRFTHKTPSTPTWLLATLLTLTATAAAATPAPLPPDGRNSPAAWGWVREAWRVLTGAAITQDPALPANPNRGPLIDPDGNTEARHVRPSAI